MRDIDTSNIPVDRPVTQYVLRYEIVHSIEYNSDDEDSPKWTLGASSARTEVDPRSDQALFQTIEMEHYIRREIGIESAHLVHKTHVDAMCIKDDDNNRLTLTPITHRMFDGRRNGKGYSMEPRLMIEPAAEPKEGGPKQAGTPAWQQSAGTVLDSKGRQRFKTWIKISFLEQVDYEMTSHFLKSGTVFGKEGDDYGVPVCYTFVHVLDQETFRSNLQWKADEETKKLWQQYRNDRA